MLLGKRVIRETLGKYVEEVKDVPIVNVVETLYPSLELATVNYAGPERRSPFGRLMQSLYIQKSIRGKGRKPLSAIVLADQPCRQLARALGEFLGQVHGRTFGFRSYLDEKYLRGQSLKGLAGQDPRWPVIRLLVEHLDQIRLFRPQGYLAWLKGGADRSGSTASLIQHSEGKRGGAGVKMETFILLRQDQLSLPEIFDELCAESARTSG